MTDSPSKLLFAASESCADLYYLSGFMAPDAFLWLQPSGQAPLVVVSPLEFGRAQKQCRPGTRVINSDELGKFLGKKAFTSRKTSDVITVLSSHFHISEWLVPADFPFGLASALMANGLKLTASAAPFCPERNLKSEAEIACVSKALRITEAGLNCGLEALRQAETGKDNLLYWHGELLTAEILRGEIDCEIARRGGQATGTITAPGPQGADPHQTGHGPIHADEPIVIDIFPRDQATGYFGDLTRTVVKGKAPDFMHRVFETVHQAQLKAFDMLTPDVCGIDVHNTVATFFKEKGYETRTTDGIPCGFFHGLGHGLGLEIHECPCLNLSQKTPLGTGAVVTVEPGLYYPEWGGIRLEDVAAITDKSCKNLTFAPIFLEI